MLTISAMQRRCRSNFGALFRPQKDLSHQGGRKRCLRRTMAQRRIGSSSRGRGKRRRRKLALATCRSRGVARKRSSFYLFFLEILMIVGPASFIVCSPSFNQRLSNSKRERVPSLADLSCHLFHVTIVHCTSARSKITPCHHLDAFALIEELHETKSLVRVLRRQIANLSK